MTQLYPPQFENVSLADLPDGIREKIPKVLASGKNVVLVTGQESPTKIKAMVVMLKQFDSKGRTVSWMHNIDPAVTAYVQAYPNAEILYDSKPLRETIVRAVNRSRFVIVGCLSVESLEQKIGKDAMDYISHSSVILSVPVPRAEIPEL